MNASPNAYASTAAGDALHSAAWLERKKEKQLVSTREKESKLMQKAERELVDVLARPLDLLIDRLIARVEEVMRRGGADQLVEKLNAILPDGEVEL